MLKLPSPIMEVKDKRLIDVRLFVKRDDLIHSAISGNKWRKLKYNVDFAQKNNCKILITKGGAFSNHIFAVASVGKHWGFKTIGLIRGELTNNHTLDYARSCGMQLIPITRAIFPTINANFDFNSLGIETDTNYFIPEGGTNRLAVQGTREIVSESIEQLGFCPDFWCIAAGTGGTATGIIEANQANNTNVLVFSALKGDFLKYEIETLLGKEYSNWQLETTYHFGGYAKFQPILIDFINDFYQETDIPLDPIYTGKLFYGVFDKIVKGFFPKGSKILAVHSGGLQGVVGFNERFGNLLHMKI